MKLGHKLGIFSVINLLLLVGAILFAEYQMASIGNELEEIAEEDIPLSNALTTIKGHQLEQEIQLERYIRHVIAEAPEEADRASAEFLAIGKKVDRELQEAEEFAREASGLAHSEETAQKMRGAAATIAALDKDHKKFQNAAVQLKSDLKSGDMQAFNNRVSKIEEAEKQFSKKLTNLGSGLVNSARI